MTQLIEFHYDNANYLDSTVINFYLYNSKTRHLLLELFNRTYYVYENVNPTDVHGLLNDDSPGNYWNNSHWKSNLVAKGNKLKAVPHPDINRILEVAIRLSLVSSDLFSEGSLEQLATSKTLSIVFEDPYFGYQVIYPSDTIDGEYESVYFDNYLVRRS